MLDNIQRFEPTAPQAVQVDNALAINPKLRVPDTLAATMSDKRTLQFLVPFVVDMIQIFDDVLVFIQIEG